MAEELLKVLRWEEPPAGRRVAPGRGAVCRYQLVAEQLRDRRGEWGVICESAVGRGDLRGLATLIRRGALEPFAPCGDFDAVSRTRGGIRTVYARFLGDGEDGCE